MVGEKKVGKFLTATRVPYELRDKILIVSDREKIIWIYPVRMSEQAKLNGQTRRILKMNIDFC
jgi:DNA/RNA-binding domain of Phe-tRNA-synthetase-like protein